jgi:hypothetical protein
MKILRNIGPFLLAGVLALVMSFGATYAYLYDWEERVNEFVIGEDEGRVTETFVPPTTLVPGIQFDKKAYVENTGNLPMFVRMRVEFSSSKAQEFCEPIVYDTANWQLDPDGYWYYKSLLMPGELTTALFQQVKIKAGVTESDLEDFDIIVYAETRPHKDHAGAHPANEWREIWNE